MPATSLFHCRSARSIRPTSPPTRTPESAITLIRSSLTPCSGGIRKDGARLYPAMPYTSYTFMSDNDVLAIKAYLFSLPTADVRNRPDTLQFPFNQRWAMIFWSWGNYPDSSISAILILTDFYGGCDGG
jgi:hypothetical protein